ncbi:hypothetical protein C6501_01535 [Candidatus Poribacteria bacterium]|nr:MAG: hypothetical protein C6501_01535 [Candidatus Poribacteria bacterium]
MFTKLSFRNVFSLALLVLFSTICLFPMNLSAAEASDMDNLYIHKVSAQTMASASYYHPDVYSGSYANIDNYSGNIPVRYYYSDRFAVWRGGKNPIYRDSASDKGWVNPGGWISFLPWFSYDMTGRFGKFTATSNVELGLKFDFDGDGVFDDGRSVRSSAQLEFTIERPRRRR